MSTGTKSHLFKPVSSEMLPVIKKHFDNVKPEMIDEMFSIMTDRLVTETLLFVALVGMVSRYLKGEREDEPDYGAFGAGTKLSAVKKDGTGKMQTPIMELLHDVIVEMQMAGGNFRRLQKYLGGHGLAVVSLHSCYMLVISADDVDAFYDACGNDQMMRTALDWSGETEKNVSLERVLAETEYSQNEARFADECRAVAEEAIALTNA